MTPEEIAAQEALLKKVKETAATEIETRGYQDAAKVQALIDTHLEGLPLEQLRSFEATKTDLEAQLLKVAGEVEKMQNRNTVDAVENPFEALFTQHEGELKDIMQHRKAIMDGGKELKLNIRAAAVMTTGNTIDETTNAVPVAMVENMSMGAYASKRRGVQFIESVADITTVQSIAEYKTWLEEGNEEGAFAIVAEGGLKPLVSTGLVRNFAKAKKIAGKYIITEEFAKFRANALNIIRTLINDKLVRDQRALLVTDLNSFAAGYVGTSLDDTIVAPNDYDAIGAVAAQIETLNFVPDVLILHPQDAWRIRLEKDGQGRYQFPVTTENGQTVMLGIRVVTSTYQTAGSFTLGESGLFKVEEEPITIRMGYGVTVTGSSPVTQVVSDFDNNQMRMIVEMFFNDYIPTPYVGSFVKASFATVKAALLKP